MVLVQRIEKHGTTVLVFEGNDEGKTVEQILGETIYRLAPNGGPVDSWAIHFCSMYHPFSTTQRLREMAKKWKKTLRSISGAVAYYFCKREFKYDFNPDFVIWIKKNILLDNGKNKV